MGKPTKKTDQKKPWALRKNIDRPKPIKEIKKVFLIFSEGEVTEPQYFESFPITTETKVEAVGCGRSRLQLANFIIEECKKRKLLNGQSHYDPELEIWAVFDRDVKYEEDEDYNYEAAIAVLKEHGINPAYSNDSFELWLVLHLQLIEGKMHRSQYYEILTKRLKYNYEKYGKSKENAKQLYSLFLDGQSQAIKNAERLTEIHQGVELRNQNPVTTVHLLVQSLNRYIK